MGSPMDIRNALATIEARGWISPSKFLVTTPMPPSLRSTAYASLLATDGTIGMWAEGAAIPGAALQLSPVHRYGYGPIENKAWTAGFAPLAITVRADAAGIIHSFLHDWQRSVVNYNYNSAMDSSQTIGNLTKTNAWELNYKDDYCTTVTVSVFDNQGGATMGQRGLQDLGGLRPSLQIFFRDAHPFAVGDVPLSWGARGEYVKFPVQFNYFAWYAAPLSAATAQTITGPGGGFAGPGGLPGNGTLPAPNGSPGQNGGNVDVGVPLPAGSPNPVRFFGD